MKFSLECEVVDSFTKMDAVICKCFDKEYEFITNENGYLTRIKITAPAENSDKFEMTITPRDDDPEGKVLYFKIDADQVHEILTSDFQYLEGTLAFMANIGRVNWQSAKFEYLPETEEEKARIAVPWYQIELNPVTTEVPVSSNRIGQIIMRRNFHGLILNQMLAFFREGQNSFRSGRYINAFINFYLVIEACYGEKGRWRNAQTREDMIASAEFRKFVDEIIQEHLKPGGRRTWFINKMLSELKDPKGNPIPKTLDVEGIAWLLVDTRGSLLHFKIDDPHKTLRFDDDYEAIAFVSYNLAKQTINDAYFKIEQEYGKIMAERKAKAQNV